MQARRTLTATVLVLVLLVLVLPNIGAVPLLRPPALTASRCTFEANVDYGRSTREHTPASSKEECCELCAAAKPDCAVATYVHSHINGGTCWFKPYALLQMGPLATPGATSCVLATTSTITLERLNASNWSSWNATALLATQSAFRKRV